MLLDCMRGILVVGLSLVAFISIVWLREQVLHGGGPEWAVGNADDVVIGGDPQPQPAVSVHHLSVLSDEG